mgnify:CR=1 FL=1
MLSRVADNLFWMGRYLERSEHLSRYININYFSSLDAPNELSQSRQFVFQSMLALVSDYTRQSDKDIIESEVLYDLCLNKDKVYSIYNNVSNARKNASGVRDIISTELYESINSFYHLITNYSKENLVNYDLYSFTTEVINTTGVLREKIQGSLINNDVYAVIMLGVYIERAYQISNIITCKYVDAQVAKTSHGNAVDTSYEWSTLLKSVQSYDMMRSYYRKTPSELNTLEFLILNPDCPRSITNSLIEINKHIKTLNSCAEKNPESAEFYIGKTLSEYQYKTIDDIEKNIGEAVNNISDSLNIIQEKLNAEFFNY